MNVASRKPGQVEFAAHFAKLVILLVDQTNKAFCCHVHRIPSCGIRPLQPKTVGVVHSLNSHRWYLFHKALHLANVERHTFLYCGSFCALFASVVALRLIVWHAQRWWLGSENSPSDCHSPSLNAEWTSTVVASLSSLDSASLSLSSAAGMKRRLGLETLSSRDLRSFVIRFRIVRPIRYSIRIDGPIQNFRIVRAVNRHS